MSRAYYEPNPTTSEVWEKLTPGTRVRFTSGHWTRRGATDNAPYDGEGVITDCNCKRYGSIYVHADGYTKPYCYTAGWTCFEIIA